MSPIERWYRLLIVAFPPSFRNVYEDEMIAAAIDGAPPGASRPTARDMVSIVANGLAVRLDHVDDRERQRATALGVAIAAALSSFAIAAAIRVQVDAVWSPLPLPTGYWPCWAALVGTPLLLLAGTRIGGRIGGRTSREMRGRVRRAAAHGVEPEPGTEDEPVTGRAIARADGPVTGRAIGTLTRPVVAAAIVALVVVVVVALGPRVMLASRSYLLALGGFLVVLVAGRPRRGAAARPMLAGALAGAVAGTVAASSVMARAAAAAGTFRPTQRNAWMLDAWLSHADWLPAAVAGLVAIALVSWVFVRPIAVALGLNAVPLALATVPATVGLQQRQDRFAPSVVVVVAVAFMLSLFGVTAALRSPRRAIS